MKDMILCSPSPGTFASDNITFRNRHIVNSSSNDQPLDKISNLKTIKMTYDGTGVLNLV
jgi:hypothetical protein